MYQFLDEMDMWSLVEKNPKETGVLERHNTKGSSQDQDIHSGTVVPDSLVPDKWYFAGQVLTRF
jgi:hypothetical protein